MPRQGESTRSHTHLTSLPALALLLHAAFAAATILPGPNPPVVWSPSHRHPHTVTLTLTPSLRHPVTPSPRHPRDCYSQINTGELIKTLRQNTLEGDGTLSVGGPATPRGARLAAWIATNFGTVSTLVPPFLNVVSFAHRLIGTTVMNPIAWGAWGVSNNYLPLWNKYMPRGATPLAPPAPAEPSVATRPDAKRKRVVYVPACVTRMMGPARGDEGAGEDAVHDKLFSLIDKAGYEVVLPEGVSSLCCGMIMDSRGFRDVGAGQVRSAAHLKEVG